MVKNIKINGEIIGKIINNNGKLVLVYNNNSKEINDSRLLDDINKYLRLEENIDKDINLSINSKNDKLKYLLILINLLNSGVIGIALFNALITLTFISVPVGVILYEITKIISDNNYYYDSRINKDIELLKELQMIESRLDRNIIDYYENPDDFSHYVIYTEQDLSELESKYLVR